MKVSCVVCYVAKTTQLGPITSTNRHHLSASDEETVCSRARHFCLSSIVSDFQSVEQMLNRLYVRASPRCSLACIAFYRVAVEFTSRRISKGSRIRDFTPSRRYYILSRSSDCARALHTAMATCQSSRLHFQLGNAQTVDIYGPVCRK